MTYLKQKPGSLEEVIANQTKLESGFQDKFKKELEKAGKGIGSMTPKEKADFFNKMDKKHTAKNEEVIKEETLVEFTSQQIKQAYGIANDPRYKQGNYSGAVKAIEKLAKGLSGHPDVQKVLKRTNEDKEVKDKDIEEGMPGGANSSSKKGSVWRKHMKARMKKNYMKKAGHEPKKGEKEIVAEIAKDIATGQRLKFEDLSKELKSMWQKSVPESYEDMVPSKKDDEKKEKSKKVTLTGVKATPIDTAPEINYNK